MLSRMLAAAVVLAPCAAFAEGQVDWFARRVTCEVVAPADPTYANLSTARLAALRTAKARLRDCVCRAAAGVVREGTTTVGGAACAKLPTADIAREELGADGSVRLSGGVSLDALPGADGAAKAVLQVDAKGLPLGRALTARVSDEAGRTVFRGPSRYAKTAENQALRVPAAAVAKTGVSDVIVPAAEAEKIRQDRLGEGAVLFVVGE